MSSLSRVFLCSMLRYEFFQGNSARCVAANNCTAFKENIVHHFAVSRWYQRFEASHITFEDRPRSGRLAALDKDSLLTALNTKRDSDTHELAPRLGCNRVTIANYLHALCYCSVVSTWIHHALRESYTSCRVTIGELLFLRLHRKELLKDIIL
ncbi:hypothetical protein Y032_0003g1591 [Ancylostoma ceylanicum]|uniref:Mos1 transposase HTH domain-containing protein n=1 Tax=Ancylostoma ceylanicum TaxID=53326 RepID=A0A016VYI1_9BILA|nr:hypothetical protein Y032_0003g1591 [Ancylostoma ceylanicum]